MKKVGYLGIPGSYSHITATNYFAGQEVVFEGCPTFKDIFLGIDNGNLDFGVVPIENTLAGSLYENYDLLDAHNTHIVGEAHLKIEHNLLVTPEGLKAYADKDKPFTVYSQPKAIEQCVAFLDDSRFTAEPYADTANAAKFVADKNRSDLAAIASKEAAQLYGLKIAAANIQTNEENYTRFLIVGSQDMPAKNADKCSLVFYLPHVEGSLYRTLGVLSDHGCNLTKLESRPLIGKPFEYIFYFDFEYDPAQQDIDNVVTELVAMGSKPTVLGVYKADRLARSK